MISDGKNKGITFGLTVVATKQQAIVGQERATAEVEIFKENRSQPEVKGEVICTLYEPAEKAGNILDNNPHYNLLTNNCQTFCNKFLEENGLSSYSTDIQKGMWAAEAAVLLSFLSFRGSSK